jgi:3-oxoacyl-[acyl-carrier protein] reductase
VNALVVMLGSTGQLGTAVSKAIINEGIDVVGLDLVAQIADFELTGFIPCDFLHPENIRKASKQIQIENYSHVIVINCVGVFGAMTLGIFDEGLFLDSIQINLVGISHFTSLMANRCLEAKKTARFVLVGSAASHVGSLDWGYGLAKAGLNGLIRSISKSGAALGLVAIGLNPGIFESDMSDRVPQERREQAIQETHLKRAGHLEEVASVVKYLAIDAPVMLTGSIIHMSGGQFG